MGFGGQVERWRPIVVQLAGDLPVNLVLAIIWHESRGQAGAIGAGKTACAILPSSSGARQVCHALGLMQVVPRNVVAWNQTHVYKAGYNDMTGRTNAAAGVQIRLGVWVLKNAFAWLALKYGFPWPGGRLEAEQIKIGLMVYAWGQGHMKPYLDTLAADQVPITSAEISTRWPELGKPKNQPLMYSKTVFNQAFGPGLSPTTGPKPQPKIIKPDSGSWVILPIVAMAAWAMTRKKWDFNS